MDFLNTLQSEWSTIASAPWSIFTIVTVTAIAVWSARGFLAKNKADAQDHRIKLLQDRLGASSLKELEEKIKELQEKVDEIPPARPLVLASLTTD